MIKINVLMKCVYEISGGDEIKILRYADKRGITLEDATKELQKRGDIDISDGYCSEGDIKEIHEVCFEVDKDYFN